MTYDFPKQSVAQSKLPRASCPEQIVLTLYSPSKNIPDASHPVYPRGATGRETPGISMGTEIYEGQK